MGLAAVATHEPGRGSTYRYAKGCRCAECRAIHAEQSRRWDAANREHRYAIRHAGVCPDCGGPMSSGNGTGNNPTRCLSCHRATLHRKCGTLSGYQGGCRCDDCREANNAYARAYYRRRKATTLERNPNT